MHLVTKLIDMNGANAPDNAIVIVMGIYFISTIKCNVDIVFFRPDVCKFMPPPPPPHTHTLGFQSICSVQWCVKQSIRKKTDVNDPRKVTYIRNNKSSME